MAAEEHTHKKIGLYFGSFNPIHMGHLVIANHMATYTDLDEVWLVVTPQNPQKEAHEMIHQAHRLQMVILAVSENELLKGSDIEFELPQPNYTAATMRHMRATNPDIAFSLIIGEDNFERLHTWRDHWELVEKHRFWCIQDDFQIKTTSRYQRRNQRR
jgi:nicotinate-nucleotide adenylyltransferase